MMIYFCRRTLDIHVATVKDRLPTERAAKPTSLTDRERVVLSWSARGKTVADPAAILSISGDTMETHVRNAERKRDALNMTHAVVEAIKARLIDP